MTTAGDIGSGAGPTVIAAFVCGSCGCRKNARLAFARPLREDSMKAIARDGGRLEIPLEVDVALARVACPKCGYVERPFNPMRAAKLIVLVLLVAAIAFVEWVLDDSLFALLGGILALGVAAALFRKGLGDAGLLRQLSVELSDAVLPGRQVAGSACAVCAKRIVTEEKGASCSECGATVHADVCAQEHALTAHRAPGRDLPYRDA